jgi:hypothetical protein
MRSSAYLFGSGLPAGFCGIVLITGTTAFLPQTNRFLPAAEAISRS